MPYGSGTAAARNDTLRMVEEKILRSIGEPGPGGLGAGSIVSSAVDPTGALTVTGQAFCIGTGPQAGKYWTKATVGTSNAEWVGI